MQQKAAVQLNNQLLKKVDENFKLTEGRSIEDLPSVRSVRILGQARGFGRMKMRLTRKAHLRNSVVC